MEAVIIPLIIAAGTAKVISTVQQGRAARAAGEAQEAIAERNAQIAERQAEEQKVAAAQAALKQEREGEKLKGRQRALFAKSGVALRGTPLSVLVDTAQELEADRLTILREGIISAQQFESQAGIFRAKGKAAKRKGRAAYRAAILTAIGQGVGTAGSVGMASEQGFKAPFEKGGLFGAKP